MKLTVFERLVVMGVLPEKGSFVTLKVINEAREKIGFTSEEIKEYEIKDVPGGGVTWNPEGAKEKEIEISNVAKDIIKEALKELDKKEELDQRHFSLYEKFVVN